MSPEQVSTGAVHALQRFLRLFRAEAYRVFDHHLGQSDDGIKRRAQLVAHAGEELRLVLARHLQLAVLVLDLVEQAHILDRDSGLIGERRRKLDLLIGERPDFGARQGQNANRDPIPQHRYGKRGAIAAQSPRLSESVFRVGLHIGDMNHPTFQQGSPKCRSPFRLDRHGSHVVDELLREAVGLGAKEHSGLLAGNGGLVGIAESGGGFYKRLQHRLEIEGRAADDLEHVGGCGLLLQRLAEVVGPLA